MKKAKDTAASQNRIENTEIMKKGGEKKGIYEGLHGKATKCKQNP